MIAAGISQSINSHYAVEMCSMFNRYLGNKQDRCHGIIDMAGSTAGPTPAAY